VVAFLLVVTYASLSPISSADAAASFLVQDIPVTNLLSSSNTVGETLTRKLPCVSGKISVKGRNGPGYFRGGVFGQRRRLPATAAMFGAEDSSGSGSSSPSSDYSATEVKEMEELIVSLSKEPTDRSRRHRVATVFDEELAKPNGAPKRFSDLFDQVLVIVGDRVKYRAQKVAIEQQQQQEHQADDDSTKNIKDDESEKDSNNMMGRNKTKEEKQLWALVDMMVQSKTIVKRASGELGSKGSFG